MSVKLINEYKLVNSNSVCCPHPVSRGIKLLIKISKSDFSPQIKIGSEKNRPEVGLREIESNIIGAHMRARAEAE